MKKIEKIRHSLAHILAYAVQELYPGTKFGIGPAIENGFYYDFDFANLHEFGHEYARITENDLPRIEAKMRELIKRNIKFEKRIVSKEEAKEIFKDQPYKLELIKEKEQTSVKIIENRPLQVSVYKCGNFVDLCKGPHVKSTKEINPDAFRLIKIAGAYWRGSEKNSMLTRIYGIAFETKEELENYLRIQEEAEKRDHRILGEKLELFCFSDLIGPGLPLFTPKGVIIIDELKKYIESICKEYGFEKVSAPCLAKPELFEISGHAKKFGEELFHISSERGHKFVMKPVQCPHHTQIYASKPRSYRDLPIRYMESDKMYRAEKPGEVGGLQRVYAITVEDGHIFCRLDQVKDEIKNIVNIIKNFYSVFGMWNKVWVRLSVRDYKHLEKYIGDPKDWNKCEKILKEISDEMGLGAKRGEGEAAIYGPKLDFMFKDALGRDVQIPTIQLDFATPKRFNLIYINEKGKKVNPVMIHRAVLGSYERFLMLLIEHYAGALPLWLSPEQIWIVPVSDRHIRFANFVNKQLTTLQLTTNSLRIKVKDENETVSKKIREGEIKKIPYILVVGGEEMKSKTVRVRERGKGDVGKINLTKFIEKIKIEIEKKK